MLSKMNNVRCCKSTYRGCIVGINSHLQYAKILPLYFYYDGHYTCNIVYTDY